MGSLTSEERTNGAERLWSAHRWTVVTGLLVLLLGLGFGAVIGLASAIIAGLAALVILGAVASLLRVGGDCRAGEALGLGRVLLHYGVAALVVFALIQLVPYGRDHSNPPVTGEPAWDSPRTRELMVNACFACHSNEVEWPWYSSVAPFSWAVTDHVDQGRDEVNYSEFDTHRGEADETLESILEGEMPPGYYTRFGFNPEADLDDAERAELIAGLRATPGLTERDEGREREHDDD